MEGHEEVDGANESNTGLYVKSVKKMLLQTHSFQKLSSETVAF